MNTISKPKVLFCVQGEGRGHMTQAIAMQNMLIKAGYEVCAVLVGRSSQRQVPPFFYEQIKAPVTTYRSPNFLPDRKKKGIRIIPSVLDTLFRLGMYLTEMRKLHHIIEAQQPDLVINFYDPLIGLYYKLFGQRIPMVCVAHQYVYLHPEFRFPAVPFLQRLSLKWLTAITAFGSSRQLALSMYPFKRPSYRKVEVVPPLLREDVFRQQPAKGDYLLAYLLNEGYMEEIIAWHQEHPEVKLHCFTDKKDMPALWQYDETLTFHRLSDKLFLELMAGCRGLASTAGFESVCEAMYLGKPVFMVPVQGQFEQYCNARDAAKAGAGIYAEHFALDNFMKYLSAHETDHAAYRQWVDSAQERILNAIGEVMPAGIAFTERKPDSSRDKVKGVS